MASSQILRGDRKDPVAGEQAQITRRGFATASEASEAGRKFKNDLEVSHRPLALGVAAAGEDRHGHGRDLARLLLERWPRLRDWIADDRGQLRERQQLSAAARAWATSGSRGERDRALLAWGKRLAAAKDLHQATPGSLAAIERDYVAASTAAERRSRRMRQATMAALVGLAVAVVGAALLDPDEIYWDIDFSGAPVAITADGSRAAVGKQDGDLTFWDLDALIATACPVAAHDAPIWDLAFSSDETKVFASAADGAISIWDATAGRAVGSRFLGHLAAPGAGQFTGAYDIAPSPDGRRVASCDDNGGLIVWERGSGEILWQTEAEADAIVCATLSHQTIKPTKHQVNEGIAFCSQRSRLLPQTNTTEDQWGTWQPSFCEGIYGRVVIKVGASPCEAPLVHPMEANHVRD